MEDHSITMAGVGVKLVSFDGYNIKLVISLSNNQKART